MKNKIIAFVMLILLLCPFMTVNADEVKPSYWIKTTELLGDKVQMDFMVNNFSEVYGAQMYLEFNKEALVADNDDIISGDIIPENSANTMLIDSGVDAEAGVVKYIITKVGQDELKLNKGTLFSVVFTKKNSGSNNFKVLDKSILSNSNGDKIDFVNIIPVESISLDKNVLNIKIDGKGTLIASINPDDATNKEVVWASDNEKVATVDQKGNVTAVSEGSANISVTAKDGGLKASCTVNVESYAVTGISLNYIASDLLVGDTLLLKATVTPSNAGNKDVTWKSSNSKVASVDDNGLVTAKAEGEAIITATSVDGGLEATSKITVIDEENSVVERQKIEISVGDDLELVLKTLSDSNMTLVWTSSKPKVATVDNKGNVKAIAEGSTIIEVKDEDGELIATCEVTVNSIPDETDKTGEKDKIAEELKDKLDQSNDIEVGQNSDELAEAIEELVEEGSIEDGITLRIDITNNSNASKKLFEAIEGKDLDMVFFKDGLEWTINGKDVDEDTLEKLGDIDLSLKEVPAELEKNINDKVEEVAGEDVKVFTFSYNYDGELPGEFSVKIFVGKEWAGKKINVYRYYPEKDEYEIIDNDIVVDSEGYMEYKTDHCSDYFIAEASTELAMTDSDVGVDTDEDANADTGTDVDGDTEVAVDTNGGTNILLIIGMLVIALGVVLLVMKKKKK